MIHGKKAAIPAMNLADYWVELLALALLIVGFVVSLSSGSAVISYAVIFLSGMILGRLWYKFRNTLKIAWVIVILGFLAGFMLGSRYGNRTVITVFFISGFLISYIIHEKELVRSI